MSVLCWFVIDAREQRMFDLCPKWNREHCCWVAFLRILWSLKGKEGHPRVECQTLDCVHGGFVHPVDRVAVGRFKPFEREERWGCWVHTRVHSGCCSVAQSCPTLCDPMVCEVVWTFFEDIALLWDWNENWCFSVLWPLLSFPNLLAC